MNNRICIIGADGFIGKSLFLTLSKSRKFVCGTVRSLSSNSINNNYNYIPVGDIRLIKDWESILKNIECVIHAAGRTNINIKDYKKKNELKYFQSINLDATIKLAEGAAKVGVKKFVLLSTIKVNGESSSEINEAYVTNDNKKFNINDLTNPQNDYAKSKLEAEKALWEISSRTGLEVVVVRLPLVYGYGAKGNLERLIKLVKSKVPLPLSLVKNQRSMIGIDNLVDLLIRCIEHQEASGKTFLASDGEDLSTPELIKLISSSMGRKANLFPFPISMLKFLCSVFGKREEINRLVGSLRIDNSYTKKILNWTPPVSVEEGIRRMVQGK